MSQQSSSANSERAPLVIGIDWADRKHDVCLIGDDGQPMLQTFEHNPDAIDEWLQKVHREFPNRTLFIAIEQSRGALVHALRDAQDVVIYPVNPKQLARFREGIYPAGSKSDPNDARLLATLLLNHRDTLRPWQPDDEQTRKLAYLSELRRKLVDERKRLGLRLLGTLKLYFPLALTLFDRTVITEFVLDLLKQWASLEKLKRVHPKTLREFFRRHGVKDEDRQTTWINAIRNATTLTNDQALIQSHTIFVQSLARQITEINRAVAEFDAEIRRLVTQHPDYEIFHAIPGAGDALIPRLIAAFGSDRDRYESANQIQSYSGIAPITKKSGQTCLVFQRHACPHFLKQTFHEFAEQARIWSDWSNAFYKLKRSQGMKHNAAVRQLAFKWIRIMFQLWKSKTIYSEKHYLEQLQKKGSPAIAFLVKT